MACSRPQPDAIRVWRETNDLDFVLSGYRAIPPNEDITRRAYYRMKTYARSHGLRTLDSLIAATAPVRGDLEIILYFNICFTASASAT